MILKDWTLGAGLLPPWGNIHIHSQERLANQSQTSCGSSVGKGTKVCINGPGHMTKMAVMAVISKNF